MIRCLFFMFLLGCFLLNSSEIEDNSYPDVMKLINEYSAYLKAEENIIRTGYGLYYAGRDKIYDGKIHIIDLGYAIDKRIQDCEEAKKLFYSLVDGLLDKINANENLKKYFYHSPVGYEDLYIRLSFDYEGKGLLRAGDIKQVNIFENRMNFLILEQGEPNKIIQKEVYPDVFILEDILPKTRRISINLPEQE